MATQGIRSIHPTDHIGKRKMEDVDMDMDLDVAMAAIIIIIIISIID